MNDSHLGDYVYCASHVGPHLSGWCTVPASDKLGLLAETADEAHEEVKFLKLPWYNHCSVCYKYVGNESYRDCPEHSVEEIMAARTRRRDLEEYLWERRYKQGATNVK